MTEQGWTNALIAGGIVCPLFVIAGVAGWFIHWFWFETLYHPFDCRCRRCRHRLAVDARHKARLARASRR